jgi:hypothetical protein
MILFDTRLQRLINGFVILFVILQLTFSLFLSDYFIELPSILKEIIYLPLILLFIAASFLFPNDIRITPFFYPFLVWLLLFSIIGIFNKAPDTFAIRYYLFTTFTYVFFQQFLNKEMAKKIFYILLVYFVGLILVGLTDLVKNFGDFKTIFLSELVFENLKVKRLYLWFNVPNIAGGVLSVLMLFFYFYTRKKWSLIFGLPVLFIVFSRTALASFLISILVYWSLKNRKRPLFILLISLLLIGLINFLIIFSSEDFAFQDRIELSKSVINGDINYLGKGIGFVTASGRVANIVVFDNDYLRFIYEIGIFGLILYLLFLITALHRKFTIEIGCFTLNFLIIMYMGEVHSMYPIGFLFYMCLAVLQFKVINDDLLFDSELERRRSFQKEPPFDPTNS